MADTKRVLLLKDEYESLTAGALTEGRDGPYREMHAQAIQPNDNMGGWTMKVGHWGLPKSPFHCVETPGGKQLVATAAATVFDNVHIAKGDFNWKNYTVEAVIERLSSLTIDGTTTTLDGSVWKIQSADGQTRQGWGGPIGLIARYQTSRDFYAAVIDRDGMAKLIRNLNGQWDVLASQPIDIEYDKPVKFSLTVRNRKIRATIGGATLNAKDGEFTTGCIGLMAAQPARFSPVSVVCSKKEKNRLADGESRREKSLLVRRSNAPKAVLWKKFDTPGFGTGRRIRVGDLTGDGKPNFVFCRPEETQGKKSLFSLVATTMDGEILWTLGEPPENKDMSSSGSFQIHDIDGDGKNEVIAIFKNKIHVLDGATGKEKYAEPLPKPIPTDIHFRENTPHWGAGFSDQKPDGRVGGSIAFADLSGSGARRDVILVDSYHQAVALKSDLKTELWRTVNVHGHYPLPVYNLLGDGRDSVLMGFRHVNYKGETVGRVILQDHQDAIFCGPLDDDGKAPYEIWMASGEDGLLRLTPDYDIHMRDMGHVQRIAIGKFDLNRRGLQVASVLFHGNRGIVSLFDSTMKRLWTREYPVIGQTMQPVLFDDSGKEYMLLSAIRPLQGYAGGLVDATGDLVVPLPNDGGPGECAWAVDLDGDGLDELIVWDTDRVWIYHSDATPAPGRVMKRVRPPLYNVSNFISYYSLPDGVRI